MHTLRLLTFAGTITLLLTVGACTSPTPQTQTAEAEADTLTPMFSEEELVNDEPPQPPVRLPTYDGTAETARKQVAEILDAVSTMRLSGYSYLYDNGSGENPMNGGMYFSPDDDFLGKGQEWYLRLYSDYYAIEYFFDDEAKLFAIRQQQISPEVVTVAEIFYIKEGGLIEGSWLQRTGDERIELSTYEGDYWYDFLEGYPMYPTLEAMKADASLQYQQ